MAELSLPFVNPATKRNAQYQFDDPSNAPSNPSDLLRKRKPFLMVHIDNLLHLCFRNETQEI